MVDAGGEVPPAWSDAPEVTVDEAALVDPEAVVTALHEAWAGRSPVTVRLAVDAARFRDPVDHVAEAPWLLDPGLEMWLDRLHFLVWANTYDARAGDPVWWWGRKAVRLGATEAEAEGDVVLPDGTVAWVDGGPRGGLAPGDVGAALVHAETIEAGLLTPVPARTSASPQVDPTPPPAEAATEAEAATHAGAAAAASAHAGTAASADGDGDDGLSPTDEPGPDGGDPDDDDWFAWVSAQEAGTAQPAAPVSLAPDQLAAVEHGAGPARIIAPAGSGKTRVLTARLRHLVVDRGYEPSGVVAVAYNRKARDEMAERSTGVGARILTLNALGYDLVATGLGRRPNVIDQREVRSILEPLVPKVARRLNTDPLAPYLDALGAVRLGLRDPLEVEEARGDVPGLADAFPSYRAELRRRGVIDFDEQVLLAIELLLTDGAFRRAQQARYRHLLVDEFQDLTPAHVLLVRLLACPRFDVFGVGDDDQVIYGHAGAAPRFLTDYGRYLPGADAHALEVNYRCPPAVVDAARTLLTWNRTRVPKTIRAARQPEPGVEALRILRHEPQAGATELVEVVRGWLDEPGIRPRDVAVLARVGSALLAPHVALVEAGVPITSTLRPDVLRRTGLRAALAYLRIAASPDRIAGDDLLEVRRRPSRGLPNWADKWLGRCRSIDDVAVAAGRIDDVKVSDKFAGLADDLHEVARRAAQGSTREVLEYVLDGVGLGQAVELLDASGGGDGPSHRDDLEALIQVADLHPDPGGFEPWLRERLEKPDSAGGVTLSTVHRVKGREWPRVAVFGASDGLVPHRLTEGRAGVEEERRVFHVAITRGIERVVVLADASRPSPFLAQLTREATAADLAEEPVSERDELAARRERRRQRLADAGGGSAGGRARGAGAGAAESDADPALVEALKGWRRERSKADNVPAYVVLNDKYLTGIAERRPADLGALARCPGIGPAKLDAYGDDILDILQAHAPSGS